MKKTLAVLGVLAAAVFVSLLLLAPGPAPAPGRGNLDELVSLPYLAWSEQTVSARVAGVVAWDRDRACPGYTLYADGSDYAWLLDLEGRPVHRWRFPDPGKGWDFARLLDGGGIVAFHEGESLVRLDRESRVVWELPIGIHHEISPLDGGDFLVAVSNPHRLYRSRLVEFDSVRRISSQGEPGEEWATFTHFSELRNIHGPTALDAETGAGGFARALQRFYASHLRWGIYELDNLFRRCLGLEKYSYYHLNSAQALPRTELGRRDERFRAGNWLICLRNVNLVLAVDPRTGKIVWEWGADVLDWPHMPRMLENGRILVFDNGYHRGFSRILEIDPVSGRTVWSYLADPPQAFSSPTRGSCQRLPNGNTLICESDRGRIFEVDPAGATVWEFYNPKIEDGRRGLIYRALRLPPERVEGWLSPPPPAP
ncbi:MAG TPA: arylsulfotransferase family protein [bacterium]|nr:arylsulfotransferase family protein [bacterium]HPQ65944.1 arylsulfotransferase family protein [bacterium]